MVGSSDAGPVADRATLDDARSLRIVTAWLIAASAILALAALGPPLWARQASASAHRAVPLVAAGLAILFTVGWPIWTSASAVAQCTIIATTPVWMMLAAAVSGTSLPIAIQTAAALVLLISVLSAPAIWCSRRPAWKLMLWAVILAAVLGPPACLILAGTDSNQSRAGMGLHLSPLFMLLRGQ